MKAIMISIKPKWCAKILNGEKTIEVRKNKALANAIQKLIDEYGYAEFYVYCTKGKPNLWLPYEYDCFELDEASQPYLSDKPIVDIDTKMNGKVIFKFRCYKAEDIDHWYSIMPCFQQTCLSPQEFTDYIGSEIGYAIYISDLEIFDKPKELSEFKPFNNGMPQYRFTKNGCEYRTLTKAPQNFCYLEVEQ